MIMPILSVKNVDDSLAFYVQQLGFQQDVLFPGPDGKNAFAIVHLGTSTIGLGLNQTLNQRGQGVDFMVYVPDELDLDVYFGDVQKRGAKIRQAIKDEYWGDRSFGVNDPDGYVLYLTRTVKQVANEEIAAVMSGEKSPT